MRAAQAPCRSLAPNLRAPGLPGAVPAPNLWLARAAALTDVGQAEVEAAPGGHTDAEGPQGAMPQRLPAQLRHLRLILGRGHLQLVVGPDGRPALAQQGLRTRRGQKCVIGEPVWGGRVR